MTRRLTAPLLSALVLSAACAQPGWSLDWLVLVVDRSTSIDGRELTLQRDAYVRLLSDPDVIEALAAQRSQSSSSTPAPRSWSRGRIRSRRRAPT